MASKALLQARQELAEARKELRSINSALQLMKRQVSEVVRRCDVMQRDRDRYMVVVEERDKEIKRLKTIELQRLAVFAIAVLAADEDIRKDV